MLTGTVYELAHLQDLLKDDDVLSVWEYKCKGAVVTDSMGRNSVCISAEKMREIKDPKPAPKTREDEDPDDVHCDLGSDAEKIDDDKIIVDTDSEGNGEDSLASSQSDDDDVEATFKTVAPAPAAVAAATGAGPCKKPRRGLTPVWNDEYFHVWDNQKEFLMIKMREKYRAEPPDGMGRWLMSKQVTPTEFGETRAEPVRSLIILRAWAIWRARQGGWAEAKDFRARHFNEQEDKLERDIRAMGATTGGVLGHKKATALLKEILPSLVDRLSSS